MEFYGVVYLIVNMVNGKRYFGQIIQPLAKRFNAHTYADSLIGKAIRKYGKENFHCDVIKTCTSKAELNATEKHFIAVLNCKAPCGYNLTDGGEGGIPCDETRAKMSMKRIGNKNRLGKPHTAQVKTEMSLTRTGRHHSMTTCSKIGIAHRGYSPYKNLLNEIDARQLSYRRLAKLMGISNMTLSGKMRDERNFNAKEIAKLEEIFGKPAEYLLQRDDE